MHVDKYHRECADSLVVTKTGEKHTLKYLGSGSFCIVYTTGGGDVIKEYCPIIAGRTVMSRKDGRNSPFTKKEALSREDSELVDKMAQDFYNETVVINELNRAFRAKKNNMIIVPKLIETSLGNCQLCSNVEGLTLTDYLYKKRSGLDISGDDFRKYFLTVLPDMIKFFNHISAYHENGYLNLDVKPDNLFAFSIDDYTAIRNIDFGSTCGIESIKKSIAKISEGSRGGREELLREIETSLFVSSEPYYTTPRLDDVVSVCLESSSEEEKDASLKSLDVIAAWKTFVYAFLDDPSELYTEFSNEALSEFEKMDRLFRKCFVNRRFFEPKSLFSDYYVYSRLYVLNARIFSEKPTVTASEIAVELDEIRCLMAGVKDSASGARYKESRLIISALSEGDGRLLENGIKSVSDILGLCDCCDDLCEAELPEYLYNYLLTNGVGGINRALLPDISYRSTRYTRFEELKVEDERAMYSEIPIIDVFDASGESPLLISAAGGQGKTTSLELLRAELLCRNIPVASFRGSEITESMREDGSRLDFTPRTVVLIDAWDEIPQASLGCAEAILDAALHCGCKTVVTSRYDPRSNRDGESFLFSRFETARLLDFRKDEIKALLGDEVSERSEYFSLLSNTMLLSMYIEIKKHGGSEELELKNQATFIRAYFKALFDLRGHTYNNLDRIFEELGKIGFMEFIGEPEREMTNSSRYSALSNIVWDFKDEDGFVRLKANHRSSIMFCIACYLKAQISAYLRNPARGSLYDLTLLYPREYLDSLVFCGELLSESEVSAIKRAVNYRGGGLLAANLLYVLLGANGLCFDDEYFGLCDKLLSELEETSRENGAWLAVEGFLTDNAYLKKINIHSLENIPFTSFDLAEIKCSEEHTKYVSRDNCLLSKDERKLRLYSRDGKIPNGVSVVCSYAFASSTEHTPIKMPDSLEAIGEHAFSGSSFPEVTLPDGLLLIDICAFSNSSVERVALPDSLSDIGAAAFWGCDSLREVKLPARLLEIPDECFFACTALESIEMPSTLERIGDRAFAFCERLSEIYLPKTLEYIGRDSFKKCPSIKKIIFGGTRKEWTVLSQNVKDFAMQSAVTVICSDGEILI